MERWCLVDVDPKAGLPALPAGMNYVRVEYVDAARAVALIDPKTLQDIEALEQTAGVVLIGALQRSEANFGPFTKSTLVRFEAPIAAGDRVFDVLSELMKGKGMRFEV